MLGEQRQASAGGGAGFGTAPTPPSERSILDVLNQASTRMHECLNIVEEFTARSSGQGGNPTPEKPTTRVRLSLSEIANDLDGGMDALYHGLNRLVKLIGF